MKYSGFIKLVLTILISSGMGTLTLSAKRLGGVYEKIDSAKYGFEYIINENDKLMNKDKQKDFVLLIGDKFLRFCDVNRYKADNILCKDDEKVMREEFETARKISSKAEREQIYINLDESTYEFITREVMKLGYRDSIPQFEWELLEGDSINNEKHPGMTMKRAKTNYGGRIWNALYTTDIPLPYGPYFFGGLPGLIVSLWDEDKDFSVDLTPKVYMTVENILKQQEKNLEMMPRNDFYKLLWFMKKEGGAIETLVGAGLIILQPGQKMPKSAIQHYVPLIK